MFPSSHSAGTLGVDSSPVTRKIPHPGRGGTSTAALLALALLAAGCPRGPSSGDFFGGSLEVAPAVASGAERASEQAADGDAQSYHLPPPPFSEGVFPCTDCHDPELPVRTKRRTLKLAHQEIVLDHAEDQRWCLDCHDTANRDVLHLANGEPVAFEESWRLCGQCHGDKLRDWKAGAHGRRSGHWDGVKEYLLCVNCHNAHSPHFAPLKPLPPPKRPTRTP